MCCMYYVFILDSVDVISYCFERLQNRGAIGVAGKHPPKWYRGREFEPRQLPGLALCGSAYIAGNLGPPRNRVDRQFRWWSR